MARADVWDARAFTQGSLPAEPANTIELEVGKRTPPPFFCEKTKVESVSPPVGGAPFIPIRERMGREKRIGN